MGEKNVGENVEISKRQRWIFKRFVIINYYIICFYLTFIYKCRYTFNAM